jgi:CheY-like chemotaxis protein
MLDSIFDTFVQFQPKSGGLGLGLTLVKRLAELHGGSVSVRSFGANQGSEFTVRLARLADPTSVARPPARVAGATTKPMSVVVVDDHADIREMVTMLLSDLGHTLTAVASGQEGIDACIAQRPSAALIDIGLDDLDGYEVARSIARELGSSAPYLVAMTGFGQAKHRQAAFDAGFDAYLVKPATVEAITDALAPASLQPGAASESSNGELRRLAPRAPRGASQRVGGKR